MHPLPTLRPICSRRFRTKGAATDDTAPAACSGRLPLEAAMIATFLIAVAALIIAVLGCAWLKPVALRKGYHDTVDAPGDHSVSPR